MQNKNQTTPPLLEYNVTTDPTPVTISTSTNQDSANIIITARADQNVLCKYISVQVPIGDDATDMYLASPLPTASSSDPNWTPSSDPIEGMTDNTGNYKSFLFKHVTEDFTMNTDLNITVNGIVNNTAGTAGLLISELSSTVSDNDFTMKQEPKNIDKTAEQAFYLNSVYVAYTGTPENPVALVERNQSIQLVWQSNGDYFKVYSGSDTAPVSEGTNPYYTITEGLTSDTTYIIEATKDSKTLYQEYVVSVNTPDESFGSLSASAVTVAGMLSAKTLDADTSIINGTSFASQITGTNVNAQQLTVTELLDASGAVVQLFNQLQLLITLQNAGDSQTYRATTDGFVIASMPPTNIAGEGMIDGSIATGGNTFYVSNYFAPLGLVNGSLTIPVQKNADFTVSIVQSLPGYYLPIQFYWIGLGSAPVESSSYLEKNEAEKTIAQFKERQKSFQEGRRQKAQDFIAAFEEAFQKTLDDNKRALLIDKFL